MRQLYRYKIVQYFPYTKSDEFFNVGIYLYTEEKKELYLLTKEHFDLIDDCFFVKKDVLSDFMNRLKNEKNIESWYGNHLRLSKDNRRRSDKTFDEVLLGLYDDKVGYKFNNKNRKQEILKDRVKELEKEHKEKDIFIQGLYSVTMATVFETIKRSNR